MRIIAVTDSGIVRGSFPERMEAVAASGVDTIILREKGMSAEEYRSAAGICMRACNRHGVSFCVNTFHGTARELGVDDLQLPLGVLRATGRPEGFGSVGASVHSTAEAEEAVRLGADYLIAGPVFPTSCKPGREPEGIGFLGGVVSEADIPVYAIGGIGVHNIRLVARAGAAGACIRSGFMTEDDPGSLVKRLRRAAGSGRPGRD